MRIWLDDFDRKNYGDVQQLVIVNPMNIPVQVSQFAEVRQDNSPSLLERLDRQPAVTLTSESFGKPSGTLVDEAISFLKTQPLPEGVKLTWGTASEWKNGLAWVIIGGLLSSMILTVYLVPMVYYVVDTIKERFSGKINKPEIS